MFTLTKEMTTWNVKVVTRSDEPAQCYHPTASSPQTLLSSFPIAVSSRNCHTMHEGRVEQDQDDYSAANMSHLYLPVLPYVFVVVP